MKISKKKKELIAKEITDALKAARQMGTYKVLPSSSNITDLDVESIANFVTGWLDSALSKTQK